MSTAQADLVSDALLDETPLLGDQFTILTKIGHGGFGITYLARDNYLDRKVVIKECFPHAICLRVGGKVRARWEHDEERLSRIIIMFVREARRIAKMQHPNIIGVQRIFEENRTAYIVLDFVDGPTLLHVIKGNNEYELTPSEVSRLLLNLLDGVQEVHKHDFLHRDISPDNILIDKWGAPVLIDFGAAREKASRESRELSTLLVVKDGYSPQEFYFAGGRQNNSSDLYALGATFYHLISGQAPPNSQLRAADVASGCPDPCMPLTGRFNEYSHNLLKSIDMAMQVLPRDRLQSAQMWKSIIKPEIKSERRSKPLPIEKSLAKAISRVVSEINIEVGELTTSPIALKPEKTLLQQSTTLDWIHEFNAETTELASKTMVTSRIQDPSATPTHAHSKKRFGLLPRRSLNSLHYFAICLFVTAGLVILSSNP